MREWTHMALGALLAVVLLPATAPAAQIGAGGGKVTYTGTAAGEQLFYVDQPYDPTSMTYYLRFRTSDPAGSGTGPSLTLAAGCRNAPPDGAECESMSVSRLEADAGDGDDVIVAKPYWYMSSQLGSELYGGPGNDALTGGGVHDDLLGGPDDDVLSDLEGSDASTGGAGNDRFIMGSGNDMAEGGAGDDTVSYATLASGFVLTLTRSEQKAAARDVDLYSGMEHLIGSSGPDDIAGDGAANRLEGLGGDDAITGGAGVDVLSGGDDGDTIDARDGAPDTVDCGRGVDAATVDTSDAVSGCESVSASDELVPDADGDGAVKGADCDDRNPAIRPGAADVPNDGIDQDCAGGDVIDADRDGVRAGLDCDDARADVRPGIPEVPGNGRDDDCAGGDRLAPLLDLTVSRAWAFNRAWTRFRRLVVLDAPAGTEVEVRCSGRGCPFDRRIKRASKSGAKLRFTRALRGAKLKPGARLEVRMTRALTTAKVLRYRVRRGRAPVVSKWCLPPGAAVLQSSC